MVTPTAVTIDLSGPFFQKDPALTLRGNVRKMMAGLAQEGEAAVRGPYPVETGRGQSGVIGRTESLSGKAWMATAVISQTHVYPWKSGGAKQYRGGKSEARHHMFRNAYRQLGRARAVLRANLTAGIE